MNTNVCEVYKAVNYGQVQGIFFSKSKRAVESHHTALIMSYMHQLSKRRNESESITVHHGTFQHHNDSGLLHSCAI